MHALSPREGPVESIFNFVVKAYLHTFKCVVSKDFQTTKGCTFQEFIILTYINQIIHLNQY